MITAILSDADGDFIDEEERSRDTFSDAENFVEDFAENYLWEDPEDTTLTVKYSTGKTYEVSCSPEYSLAWYTRATEIENKDEKKIPD